ncbi:hypothetical protein [Arthrobacter globiformis]|uniref:hypothetical protein n=1 Tax=Arthrobacter globiformis TaxID=1665 RepID=UPI00277FBCB8|nr:hypothetical protein [Arthrobacter globiformis]MDQ0863274.1 hypothetical protein [Arthrobacter globiformis]
MSVTPAGREEGEIQAILLDSGLEDDADLRRSLEELRGFAHDSAPQPRAELAALLVHGASASGGPAQGEAPQGAPMRRASNIASLELHRRNRQRRMGFVVGAAVVGAMGLGAGAVAAASSEDFRNSVGHTVVRIFQPTSDTTAPRPTSPADVPAAPAPSGAATKPSLSDTAASPSAPATPAQTDAASSNGSSNSSAANGSSDSRGATKSQTPAPAGPSQLPTVPGTGITPKLPAKPLPAVPTLPGGAPTVPAKPVPGTP